jgi:hypothetical protein
MWGKDLDSHLLWKDFFSHSYIGIHTVGFDVEEGFPILLNKYLREWFFLPPR